MGDILVILDGMTEEQLAMPLPEVLKNAPGQAMLWVCPNQDHIDSLQGILTLLGLTAEQLPAERAYLEAMALSWPVDGHELVCRCNVVTVEDGRLLAASPLHLTGQQRQKVEHQLLCHWPEQLVGLGSCRYLWKTHSPPQGAAPWTAAPHQHSGCNLEQLLPQEPLLRQLMTESRELLKPWQQAGRYYMLWPWGCTWRHSLPLLTELHGVDGAMITGTALVRGMALAMGMVVPTVDRWTGDIDTDLHSKYQAAMALAQCYPLVVVHINGADEAAHRCQYREKQQFLQQVEQRLLRPLDEQKNHQVMVVVDHSTSSIDGRHFGQTQPCWLLHREVDSTGAIHAGCDAIPLLQGKLLQRRKDNG